MFLDITNEPKASSDDSKNFDDQLIIYPWMSIPNNKFRKFLGSERRNYKMYRGFGEEETDQYFLEMTHG